MKIVDVITFRRLLIFPEISGNIECPENLQPYVYVRMYIAVFKLVIVERFHDRTLTASLYSNLNKKLSYRRETARRSMSFVMLLSWL